MTRPARQDLHVSRSGTLNRLVRFKADAVAMDLTDWTARMVVTAPDGTELLRLTNQAPLGGSGLGWVERPGGEVELYVSNADVQNLPPLSTYQVILTSPAGDPQPYLQGKLVVTTP